jgi:hypothetical protein
MIQLHRMTIHVTYWPGMDPKHVYQALAEDRPDDVGRLLVGKLLVGYGPTIRDAVIDLAGQLKEQAS